MIEAERYILKNNNWYHVKVIIDKEREIFVMYVDNKRIMWLKMVEEEEKINEKVDEMVKFVFENKHEDTIAYMREIAENIGKEDDDYNCILPSCVGISELCLNSRSLKIIWDDYTHILKEVSDASKITEYDVYLKEQLLEKIEEHES